MGLFFRDKGLGGGLLFGAARPAFENKRRGRRRADWKDLGKGGLQRHGFRQRKFKHSPVKASQGGGFRFEGKVSGRAALQERGLCANGKRLFLKRLRKGACAKMLLAKVKPSGRGLARGKRRPLLELFE